MAKKQDFASKTKKKTISGNTCPKCGNTFTVVRKVQSYFSEETHSWKYYSQNVKVCDCNEKEVYA
ncbi:MAG: hypothetical protein GWN01_06810 [Nitrosopumilaceae archaeon]|nr:hypothetical protein [Nitrosopumilaceae archaeon]NIU85862.1 hypothetical protein [Nitrosopumilaceae archaeon]NIX61246.1 hypothetical protein [Nitrosopumilaceae archaeon]